MGQFHECFRDISRKFKGFLMGFQVCLKGVSKKLQGVLRIFQGRFTGVSRKFLGLFEQVLRGFYEGVKDVSRVF